MPHPITMKYLLLLLVAFGCCALSKGDKTEKFKLGPELFDRIDNVDYAPDPAGSGETVLRVFYAKHSHSGNRTNQGGYSTVMRGIFQPGAKSMTLRYELYFSDNFVWNHGGKLPGLYGGLGKCSGGDKDPRCFGTRYMWRREGDGEIYGYLPNEHGDWFCDHPLVFCNFRKGHSFGRGSFKFQVGRWQKLKQRITLNDPGQSNGRMVIYYEDEQVYELGGLIFREDEEKTIDSLHFSTFFGGSTARWGAPTDCYTYFRNWSVTNHD